ncbi:MAG: cystathionine beta-lyase [Alphaproteobacteria bacterium]|nr:cystathionine beta-lyase [Alphaproteobacteria bacterium]
MKEDTKIVTAGRHPERFHGAVNPPIYRASTILFETVADLDARKPKRDSMFYGRHGTPTTFALEEALCVLEGGTECALYPSGLAACNGALLAFLEAGNHLLVADCVYGPTRRFCDHVLKRYGVETTYFDPLIGAGIEALFRPTTRVVFLESPGSLTFEVQDVPAIAAVAQKRGATVILDNTWATPLFFKALDRGVDVSVHAATKYIVGHSDAMLGVATANATAAQTLKKGATEVGFCAGPDDIYLAQRGLRTLGVRLRHQEAAALDLAGWLARRPEVARVLHPALEGDPGHALWRRDFTGASGLFGLVLEPASAAAVAAMLDGLELYGMGASWGGFESLIMPTHPERFRTATQWRAEGPSLRINVGLEDIEDLKADLDAGFTRLRAAA